MKSGCYGILPMAGKGSRIQPIAFSKELYPVAYRNQHFAISEFSIRGMLRAQVDEIKLVINPEKMDIVKYYSQYNAPISMYFHDSKSLPESCLFPTYSLHDNDICLFGLPDTLFSPNDAYSKIRNELEKGKSDICLGLFEVDDGGMYDSVSINNGRVTAVAVKQTPPLSNWIWGMWGARVSVLKLLKKKIQSQKVGAKEKLLGVGFNSLIEENLASISAIKLGHHYFDIGTMDAIVRVKNIIDNFEL